MMAKTLLVRFILVGGLAQAQEAHLPRVTDGKPRVLRSWKMLPMLLLLALFLSVGSGVTHAATRRSAINVHPNGPVAVTMRSHRLMQSDCDYQFYPLGNALWLTRDADGYVVELDGHYNVNQLLDQVRIWNNGVYAGDHYLPASDGPEIVIFHSGEYQDVLVAACSDWSGHY
jgi:hypothetical protein